MSLFQRIAEFSSTQTTRTEEDLAHLERLERQFDETFEAVYIESNEANVHRAGLSFHQLLHTSQTLRCMGSNRIGSQATCERAIGELGHRVRSQTQPFVIMANQAVEREQMRILSLLCPALLGEPYAMPRHQVNGTFVMGKATFQDVSKIVPLDAVQTLVARQLQQSRDAT